MPARQTKAAAAADMDLTKEAGEIFEGDKVDDPVVDFSTAKRPVIAKLATIMASLPTLLPEGRNNHFGYNFIKDTQISGAVRPRMARLGLMLIPIVLEEEQVEIPTRNGKSYLTKLKVQFEIIDAESGDMIKGVNIGYGDDAGDKGANKALTAAEKYFLMKLFQIGGEDLEDDAQSDKRASERESGLSMRQDVEGAAIVSANITGVAKGGKQDAASSAQINAITATIKQLGWNPDEVITAIDLALGDALDVSSGNAGTIIKDYLRGLSGDDAGKLLTALKDAVDAADKEENADGGDPA